MSEQTEVPAWRRCRDEPCHGMQRCMAAPFPCTAKPITPQTTERQREIAQGLRDESGALIGGLVVFDYIDGIQDWKDGKPPPPITSTSYDLGRAKAARDAELKADVLRELAERQAASHAEVRKLLAHRPDLLVAYDAKMAALRTNP